MLYVMVEGDDDERFIDSLLRPELERVFGEGCVVIWQYAQKTKRQVRNLVNSVRSMDAEFVFLCDQDQKPCITRTKEAVQAKHPDVVPSSIIVVVTKIEDWYLSGISAEAAAAIGIKSQIPRAVTKEEFRALIPAAFVSRVDFLVEVLRRYSWSDALVASDSLNYFVKSLGLHIA